MYVCILMYVQGRWVTLCDRKMNGLIVTMICVVYSCVFI